MKLASPAFAHGESIPVKYTCQGDNISPPLTISDVPASAQSLALIMDDPDAPGAEPFVHWLSWNIDPDAPGIEEGSEPNGVLGTTSYQTRGYGSPCPPDREHRYFFKLYALDTELDLAEGATKQQLLDAMKGHVIDQAELMGRYEQTRS